MCCGLVMKEDITQLAPLRVKVQGSCGLVMKEDITQQAYKAHQKGHVVVW